MIREIKISDYNEIQKLSTNLGFALPKEVVKENIKSVLADGQDKIFAEVDSKDNVIGYIQIAPLRPIYFKPLIDIIGMVVDEKHRRKGIGRNLINAAKDWAVRNGFEGIRAVTQIKRMEAHNFYSSVGFNYIKTQKNYRMIFKS